MRVACGLAVAAGLAALAPPASADWLAPLPVSAAGQLAITPAAAVGPDGTMIVAWAGTVGATNKIHVAMHAPGGALEDPQVISAGNASAPKALIDGQGNAVVVWEEGSVYRWAVRAAGASAFGPAGTVTLPVGERPFSNLSLAAAPDGTVAAVGITMQDTSSTSRIRVMTRAPGGDFVLEAAALDQAQASMTTSVVLGDVDMDADAQGGLYATWTKRVATSPTTTTSIRVGVRPPGAASFGVENVADGSAQSGNAVGEPVLSAGTSGVDAAGNLTVGFVQRYDDGGGSEVRLRSRPAGGAFGAGSTPITPVNQASGPTELALDMNAAGTGIVAWGHGNSASGAVEACVLPAAGPCGATQPLAAGNVFAPSAAIGARGDIVVAWRRTSAAADARFAPAGGAFGAAHQLGSGTQVLVPREAVDMDPLGDAVLAIDHATSGARNIEAIVNDSAPPSITSAPPTSGQPGEPLAFGADIVDVWSTFTSTWDFGDGATVSGPVATHTYPAAGAFATTLTATDSEGNSATHTGLVKVADTIAPGVVSFDMTHRVFAVGAHRTPLAGRRHRAPRGTAFRFNVTETGSVRIQIQRARPGRRVRGRCRKPSKRLRSRKRCTRWSRAGTLTRRVAAGETRVAFSGRLGRKALKPGAYRAVLVARDAAGNRSSPALLRFRVVRR